MKGQLQRRTRRRGGNSRSDDASTFTLADHVLRSTYVCHFRILA